MRPQLSDKAKRLLERMEIRSRFSGQRKLEKPASILGEAAIEPPAVTVSGGLLSPEELDRLMAKATRRK
jgi:hypothetical protein